MKRASIGGTVNVNILIAPNPCLCATLSYRSVCLKARTKILPLTV